VREYKEAAEKLGLKFGVYVSPWDRNNAEYARPAYQDTYLRQVQELASNYGDLFYMWFDRANGGDGYYGGANETRSIDAATYYRWEIVCPYVHSKNPLTSAHHHDSIYCHGTRYIGNEGGIVGQHIWASTDYDRD
jgi:alpha-L-fucosidase